MKKCNVNPRTIFNMVVIIFVFPTLSVLSFYLSIEIPIIAQPTNVTLSDAEIISRSIPTGGYNIQSNGLHGTLNITSLDGEGNLNGTIDLYPWDRPASPVIGYFDPISGKIALVRIIGPQPHDIEVYTGYKFGNIIANCISGTGPGSCFDIATGFAGTFQSFSRSQVPLNEMPNATKNTFGWYASHIPQPCPACPN